MADFGHKEVISVLGQWELELTQLEQQRRSLRYVRDVMTRFQEAVTGLAILETQREEVQGKLDALRTRYNDEKTKAVQARDAAVQACATETADAKVKAATIKKKIVDLEQALKDKETFVATRSAQLEAELQTKTADLAKLTASFETFKRQHGLAS